MFFAKTCGKTVSLSFQCYFRCLAWDHWPLPAVYYGTDNEFVIMYKIMVTPVASIEDFCLQHVHFGLCAGRQ